MPRRVGLPGASELFRPTQSRAEQNRAEAEAPRTTGRVKHDEKFTVYVSAEELVALEQARLTLRAAHGLGVDRGRIVRAAVALAVADLAERGDSSDLVQRLQGL